jgi:hypothetical protein
MSLINTRIQNIRAKGNLDKNELRPGRYGALDLFMLQSEDPAGVLTPELKQKAETSIGNVLQTPVIDYDAGVTISNARSVTIADSENTSQLYTITFATYAWGFTIVPAMYMNNEISMQQDFERKFNKYLYKFGETLDSAAIAALSAAKTQVFGDLLQYTKTGNVIQCPWKLRENVIGDVNPMMAANDHFGQIHVVGNAGIESVIRKMSEKDVYNAENKTLEYSDKILHFTTRIANAGGEFANFYAVQGGSLGILTRFERECLLGTEMADGTSWSIDALPLLNFPIGTYYYESKGDFHTIGGAATADMDRVRKEHYGFAVDIALITPYVSDAATIAMPIMKFAVLSETLADYSKVVISNPTTAPVYTTEVV